MMVKARIQSNSISNARSISTSLTEEQHLMHQPLKNKKQTNSPLTKIHLAFRYLKSMPVKSNGYGLDAFPSAKSLSSMVTPVQANLFWPPILQHVSPQVS